MLQRMLYIATTAFSSAKMFLNHYRHVGHNNSLTIHEGTLFPHLTQHPSIFSSYLSLSYDRSVASSEAGSA